MNKILLRISISLAILVTLLGFFIVLAVDSTNSVRREHFVHDIVKAPLMNMNVTDYRAAGVDLVGLDDSNNVLEMSDLQVRRLQYGQVVLVTHQNNKYALKKVDNDRVARLLIDHEMSSVYQLYLQYIRRSASSAEQSQFFETLKLLEVQLNIELKKLKDDQLNLSQDALNALADKGEFNILSEGGLGFKRCYVKLVSGEILVVDYLRQFSQFSWWLFLFLLSVSVSLVVLLAYYFVEGFSYRLRAIETAASRLSRGELDARVSKVGEEDAISRLGTAFNAMADHIQRLMYVQKEMIHAVSHELRTPVARIRFGVQMIEDCTTPEAMSKQVKGIDGDIQELDELIDEILTYARLEQGGPILAFQEADIKAIVDQVIGEQSIVKPEMNILAEYKDGSEVWKMSEVETRYIHRSIQNLVGNATRYAEGTVKVVCSFDSEACRIDVEDDGPGIPEDQWESVFTPFARLDDSRTRSSGGYGLGLSIVRRILYWHGGQAFLGRSKMGGAKFSLVWPRRQGKE